MSTNRPMLPRAGAALVSVSVSTSVPLTATVRRVPSMSILRVIHSSGANVCARFKAPVREFLAQPIELPIWVGEVLDGALVPRARRVGLPPVERAQIDRLKAVTTFGDAVGDAANARASAGPCR